MSLVTVAIPALRRVEEGFNFHAAVKWLDTYWVVTFPISAVYIVTIFTIKWLMQSRAPFNLRRLLTMWNVGLAVFSFIGAVTCVPDLTSTLLNHGLEYGNCNIDGITSQRLRLWMFIFALSKVVELGDTLFIVLRKTPLNFLHWYHHFSAMIFCWYLLRIAHEFGLWFGGMNYCVHTIMYSYYALKAMGYRLPSNMALLITTLQILQMVVGTILNLLSLRKSNVFDCEVPYGQAYLGLFIYITFLLLFINFFYQRYVRKSKKNA